MTPGASKTAARELETLFRLGTVGGLTDAHLLEQFLAHRGEEAEAAFAAVVERHGAMVLRVCRRILADPNDAEDAFQVTFLVLARKARAIARRDSLANWLYGVAVRTAKEVRKNAARRRAREEQMKQRLRVDGPVEGPDDELRAALDEELSRLPETFRAPVVLCDLEGKTHREAASLLGVPVGTVSSRLVRARDRLRTRLTRRGLDPAAADPARDSTPMAVPPALIAATSRAAARVAIEGTLAGSVPAYLATITEGVLKTMLLAKLTSKGIVVAAILFLSVGAAAVGVVSHVQLGADPEPFATARASDREWAWVDDLRNADEATRERLKRCAGSATSNFASLHRLIFDYDLKSEHGHVAESGKTTSVDRGFSRGTVYWKEGTVRYDHFPLGTLDPDGRKFLYKRPKVHSIVRSRDMLAYTEQNSVWGLFLTVTKPPRSAEEWEHQYPFAPARHVDPWLHYAGPFCSDRSKLREFWENCRAIESEESGGRVLLRFLRGDNGGRVEITCEAAADWLPTGLRAGEMREGKWIVFVELANEWQKLSGVWYPVHQVKTAYIGVDLRPVREIDLTVRNLRANGAVNLPDSAFTLSAMAIPEGTPGLDRRQEPFRGLIRAGGVVRESRPGEGGNIRNVQEAEIERRKDEETVPAGESGGPETSAPSAGSSGASKGLVPNQDYVALLEEYEPAHRAREKASLEAKGEPHRRETYLALARLDWDYAPRFMEIARKYPRDPVAIDALGWLVANDFTPPESHQAADIVIRDHLASDRMIPIYRRLAITLNPAPSSAAERLLRAAAEKAPTADARGLACLRLADLLKYRADAIRAMRGPEPDPFFTLMEVAGSGGREPARRAEEDPDALTREAVQFYDRVVEQYPDFEWKRGRLAEIAAQSLFHLRDLAVGKPAPEVEGPDVDGKPMKRSDYRGKVVVLTFSVDLPGPCRDAYPHYRALLERMKGRPFAILSLNLDENQQTLKNAIASGGITWRCWWEGFDKRPNGDRWHVGFIPSVYVIDADGIIRARDVKGKALDEAVDVLMAKMDGAAAAESRSNR